MGTIHQRQVWYVDGLTTLERVTLFRLCQKSSKSGVVRSDTFDFDLESKRCCVSRDEFVTTIIELRKKGHISIPHQKLIVVHPMLSEDIAAKITVHGKNQQISGVFLPPTSTNKMGTGLIEGSARGGRPGPDQKQVQPQGARCIVRRVSEAE